MLTRLADRMSFNFDGASFASWNNHEKFAMPTFEEQLAYLEYSKV